MCFLSSIQSLRFRLNFRLNRLNFRRFSVCHGKLGSAHLEYTHSSACADQKGLVAIGPFGDGYLMAAA